MAMNAKKLKEYADRAGGNKPKFSKAKFGGAKGEPEKEPEEDDDEDLEQEDTAHEAGETKEHEAEESAEFEAGENAEEDEELAAKVGAQVASGQTDEDLMAKLADYDPEEDGNPPSWVDDETMWERAKKAVEKNWDSYDEPWAVVSHVYKAMGGSVA